MRSLFIHLTLVLMGTLLGGAPHSAKASVSPCPLSRPGLQPRHLVFLFEGHDGYSAGAHAEWRRIVSRGLDCSQAPEHVRFRDGSEATIDSLKLSIYRHRSAPGSPNALNGLILDGLCKFGRIDFSDTEIFYFNEEEGRELPLACAAAHVRAERTTVSVFGFSHGGWEALQFANDLRSRWIEVDLGVTVDPVPKGPRQNIEIGLAYLAVSDYGNAHELRAPNGVQWMNFWQTTDNRWGQFVRGNYGLHGVGVGNANPNLHLVPQLESQHSQPNGAHWRILFDSRVDEAIANESRRIRGMAL